MIAGSFFFFFYCSCSSSFTPVTASASPTLGGFFSLPHLSQFIYTGINRFHPGQVQELAKCLVSFLKTKDGNDDGFTLLPFNLLLTVSKSHFCPHGTVLISIHEQLIKKPKGFVVTWLTLINLFVSFHRSCHHRH